MAGCTIAAHDDPVAFGVFPSPWHRCLGASWEAHALGTGGRDEERCPHAGIPGAQAGAISRRATTPVAAAERGDRLRPDGAITRPATTPAAATQPRARSGRAGGRGGVPGPMLPLRTRIRGPIRRRVAHAPVAGRCGLGAEWFLARRAARPGIRLAPARGRRRWRRQGIRRVRSAPDPYPGGSARHRLGYPCRHAARPGGAERILHLGRSSVRSARCVGCRGKAQALAVDSGTGWIGMIGAGGLLPPPEGLSA